MATILSVHAREILDSRGNPTVEVEVQLSGGASGCASVPSGTSKGFQEAAEATDADQKRYRGKGKLRAVANVNGPIAEIMVGQDTSDQTAIDYRLRAIDGKPDKTRYGANALLGVSMAVARASAQSAKQPLYRYLAPNQKPTLPVPLFNVVNGGLHTNNSLMFQEYMIVPVIATSFQEALRVGAECYQELRAFLGRSGYAVAVGDTGGFASDITAHDTAMQLIIEGIKLAGFSPGKDVMVALDLAANEFYENGTYYPEYECMHHGNSNDMIQLYESWINRYPIWSIEDGLAEDDRDGWQKLTRRLGTRVQLIGDDLFATNPSLINQAIKDGIANAALIKPNQIGTVTEALDAIAVARTGGYGTVVSHRSGDTTDDFIADLAVATACGQIKTGAPARGERVAKYNRLLRIEEELGKEARYAGPDFAARGGFRHA